MVRCLLGKYIDWYYIDVISKKILDLRSLFCCVSNQMGRHQTLKIDICNDSSIRSNDNVRVAFCKERRLSRFIYSRIYRNPNNVKCLRNGYISGAFRPWANQIAYHSLETPEQQI